MSEGKLLESDERRLEQLHTKLLDYLVRQQMDGKRGIRGPGIEFSDTELHALLRLTRVRAANEQTAGGKS
jgi:hypothetical protein